MEQKNRDKGYNNEKSIVFFGHAFIYQKDKVKTRLYEVVEKYVNLGYKNFLIGKYGDFDDISLNVCREVRKKYRDIKITVVVTSYAIFNKKTVIDHVENFEDEFIVYSRADKYSDVETTSYFIEDLHFKRRIIETNRYMVENSDVIICYIDEQKTKSGAKKAVNYATKLGKVVINIYRKKEL